MKMRFLGMAAALADVIGACASVSATIILASCLPAFAAENNHWAYLASVATYKPMAGFNHVVGPTRFVGYFLPGPTLCRVTIFQAGANDEALVVPPHRIAIDIQAAGRVEFPAGDGSALAIACTADADVIKIAPQRYQLSASRP